ncbi:uncharacterized protein LOC126678461 [Mercurialis annua]|uniref:uncharacterized protein LOC126678461 n=1 Tax=Mercurialis annua TaxID=3986 RepID=UPI00215F0635|nr:uncharacterized protein LOC126678461 [Mercurialis annua]
MSWLYRAVAHNIAESISCLDSALEIWIDLRDRFSQGDAYRIGDLQEEIYTYKQNNASVTEYYTHLKTLWDELSNLRGLPVCMCEPKCNCGALNAVKINQSNDYVIKFVRGLNDSYSVVKTQILMSEHLPVINKAFSMVIQYERQLSLVNVKQGVDSSVFMAKCNFEEKYDTGYESNVCYARGRGNNFRGGFRRGSFQLNPGFKQKLCSHCGNSGHTVDYCYRKHGVSPGFQPKYKGESSYANHVQYEECDYPDYDEDRSVENKIYKHEPAGYKHEINASNVPNSAIAPNNQTGKVFPFTPEQCQQLMALIQGEKSAERENSYVNSLTASYKPVSTSFKPIPEEKGIIHACFFSSKTYRDSWILDTGATDHIICKHSLFKECEPVNNVHVKLPTGQLISVTHTGFVQLTDDLTLYNVLYVPVFNFI